MSHSRYDTAPLLRAFAARSHTGARTEVCPQPDQLFDAASGDMELSQRERLIDHVSHCPECFEAWRIAMEVGARPIVAESERPFVGGAHIVRRRFSIAASVLAGVLFATYAILPQKPQETYRSAQVSLEPRSLSASTLPRDEFVLRWTPGPQGSSYVVRLSTADLQPLLTREGLSRSQLVVPSSVLAPLADGAQLLWQVDIRTPDGRLASSQTFVVTLE
jgi:hypothetical protein